MKFRGHGSAVAVTLSVLAVVIASGGTAVAVSSTVSIVDPSKPSQVAAVDYQGRLATGGPVATLNSAGYLTGFQDQTYSQVTSPTNATLAITRIQLSNPTANTGTAEQQLSLYQAAVASDGTCTPSKNGYLVARYNLNAGDNVDDVFTAPVIVKPTGSAYCLYFYTGYVGTTSTSASWYLSYGLTAYTTAGRYTGIGVDTASAPGAPTSPQVGR